MTELTRTHELHKRRGARNIAVGVMLGLFVILTIAVSVVKIPARSEIAAAEAEVSE